MREAVWVSMVTYLSAHQLKSLQHLGVTISSHLAIGMPTNSVEFRLNVTHQPLELDIGTDRVGPSFGVALLASCP